MGRYVFVIEDEVKFYNEIKEALLVVDEQFEVKHFNNLTEFVLWLRQFVTIGNRGKVSASSEGEDTEASEGATDAEGPPDQEAKPEEPAGAATQEEEDKKKKVSGLITPVGDEPFDLALVICKSEFLKNKGFSLLQKTRDYFISRKLCTAENPTVFVLTAFEADDFPFTRYENQVVSNIIFKPFDKLILREHLRMALSQGKPDSSGELYRQKLDSRIEMLKDVNIQEVSEISFVTYSDREIQKGARAKYYAKFFQSERLSSGYAKATKCEPASDKPGFFRCEFIYFGLQNPQITQVRRVVKADKKYETKTYAKTKGVPKAIYNFVGMFPPNSSTPKETIENKFSNITFTEYHEFSEFIQEIDPLNEKLDPSKKKEKHLPSPVLKVTFDAKMQKVLETEPKLAETATVLGFPGKKVIEDGFFINHTHNEDRNAWLELQKTGLKDGKPKIFRFRSYGSGLAFLKISNRQVKKHEKLGEVVAIDIAEISNQEKLDFLKSLSRLPANIDALFVDAAYLGESPIERWAPILELLQKRQADRPAPFVFIVSDKELDIDNYVEKNFQFEDVFYRPFDGSYIGKKIVSLLLNAQIKSEEIEVSHIRVNEVIKVAQPVMANEVSEAGLSLKYHRAIPVGSFRKVCLWVPHEVGLPEFLSSCYAVEEMEDEKKNKYFICHFVFFGVRDDSLKHIRKWLKDYYVHTKDQEG